MPLKYISERQKVDMTELKDKSTTQNRPERPVANKVGKLKSWAQLLHCEPALGQ